MSKEAVDKAAEAVEEGRRLCPMQSMS